MSDQSTMPPVPFVPFPEKPLAMDEAKILDNFDRRIFQLEQMMTGSFGRRLAYTEEGNFPDGIVIPGLEFVPTPPNVVTGLTATPGTFFENIFCDVHWTEAVTGVNAESFDVELALKTAGPTYTIINVFNTAGTNIRLNALNPTTVYGVRVLPVSNVGIRGTPTSWVDFTTIADATIPPAPSGVILARGATTVVVKFTGLTNAQAPDVAQGHGLYEIQIDTANTFATGNFRSMVSSAVVVAFNDVIGELPQWYARVRAIDSSGNASAWSTVAGPSGAMGGTNDSMIVADLNAAKITAGTMSGDRITANTLDANTIESSSITSSTIRVNGGAITVGANPSSTGGVLINSQGIRLYNPSGVLMVTMDAATGNATFTGSITASTINSTSVINGAAINGSVITSAHFRTSASGQRLELYGSPSTPGIIDYWSGVGSEVDNGYIYFDRDNPGATWVKGVLWLQPAQMRGTVNDGVSAPFILMRSASGDGVGKSSMRIGAGNSSIRLNYDNDQNEDIFITAGRDIRLESGSGRDITINAPRGLYLYGATEIVLKDNSRVEGHLRVTGTIYGSKGAGDGVAFKDGSGNTLELEFIGGDLILYVNSFPYGFTPDF